MSHTSATRVRQIRKIGHAAFRALESDRKRVQRARKSIKEGKTVSGITIDGLWHPFDCACFDCIHGEVAAFWKKVDLGYGAGRGYLVECEPARTGRYRGSEKSVES